MKRHRLPRALWPIATRVDGAAGYLPHWAAGLRHAIDRALFDTIVVRPPGEPPDPAGVREPRRPRPDRPAAARTLTPPAASGSDGPDLAR